MTCTHLVIEQNKNDLHERKVIKRSLLCSIFAYQAVCATYEVFSTLTKTLVGLAEIIHKISYCIKKKKTVQLHTIHAKNHFPRVLRDHLFSHLVNNLNKLFPMIHFPTNTMNDAGNERSIRNVKRVAVAKHEQRVGQLH